MEFIESSSQWAGNLKDVWAGIYSFVEPLVKAAEGLEKLLGLIK